MYAKSTARCWADRIWDSARSRRGLLHRRLPFSTGRHWGGLVRLSEHAPGQVARPSVSDQTQLPRVCQDPGHRTCREAWITLAEVALRWLTHHGLTKCEHGDPFVTGMSRQRALSV
ncbi:hypothetical protein BD311DRAFT_328534 [Dichomitus squalens]|uniref:Uncharacterized protein n=1 Tax=Dichomitus squalens TaxID=114155 RepID=A0A4Q9MMT6_9APHY|nr:hypothetical protein BD311DRAFT_328534 [Dichomitus squalens]